jgi:hypothetical protein
VNWEKTLTNDIIDSTEDPFAGLPDLQVEYMETSDMLQIPTGDTTGVAETIAQLAHIYRNKCDEISGICIRGASYLFTDEVLDALRRRRGNPPT